MGIPNPIPLSKFHILSRGRGALPGSITASQLASQLGSQADNYLRIYHLRIHPKEIGQAVHVLGQMRSAAQNWRRFMGRKRGERESTSDEATKRLVHAMDAKERRPAVRNSATCRDRPCFVSLSIPILLVALFLLLMLLQSQQLLLPFVHSGAASVIKLDDVPV